MAYEVPGREWRAGFLFFTEAMKSKDQIELLPRTFRRACRDDGNFDNLADLEVLSSDKNVEFALWAVRIGLSLGKKIGGRDRARTVYSEHVVLRPFVRASPGR